MSESMQRFLIATAATFVGLLILEPILLGLMRLFGL